MRSKQILSLRGAFLLATSLQMLAPSFAAHAASMEFKRILLNTGGKTPELCLRFATPLDSQAGPHYADHVRLVPAIRPDVSIRDRDLCLGGLAWATRYTVSVSPGIHDARGNSLADPVSMSLSTGDRTPTVSLAGEGFILPRRSTAGLDVQTVNMNRVRVSVWRLSPNATQAMSVEDSYPKVDTSETSMEVYQFNNLRDKRLTQIWSGTLETRSDRNASAVTAFPIAKIIKSGKPGLYLVTAENADIPKSASKIAPAITPQRREEDDSYGQSIATHWVNVSDMALSTIRGSDGLHVYARSLSTALPLKNVALRLVSQGGDELGQGITTADGLVTFSAGLLRGQGANQPVSLTATSPSGDFSTVSLTQAWFDFSDRGAEGHKAPGAQQAVIVTDRGIYRPGETINATFLLRNAQGHAVSDLPLTVVLTRPDGVKAQRLVLKSQEGGGFVTPLTLSASAAAGSWFLDAYVDPTSEPIGHTEILVQDFVPQTIEVSARPVQSFLTPEQPLRVGLEGRYLYGAPAAHLHGDGSIRIMRDDEPVPGLKGYVFGLQTQTINPDFQKIAIPQTDDAGRSEVVISPDYPEGLTVPLKAEIKLALLDPAGRSVTQTLSLPVRRDRALIGVKVTPPTAGGETQTQSVPVDVIAFAPDNKPLPDHEMGWTLVRENVVYDWVGSRNSWSYARHVIDEPIQHGKVTTDSQGRAHFATDLDYGEYRMVLSDAGSGAASSQRFTVGWWSDGSATPTAPDHLTVSVKDNVLPVTGQTSVHIQAPFAGQAQILVATDRIESARTITLPKEGIDVPIKASASWPGGAYVLVTAFRPLDAPARPHEPSRAVGLAYIGLDQSAHQLRVALNAPGVIRPQTKTLLPIKIEGAKTAHVVVSAVDQGILALTRWKQPDVFDLVYGRRAFGLDIKDSYAHLMSPIGQAGEIREGGDEGGDGSGGLSVTTTRIVSLFSGTVTADATGHAEIPLDVPDFEGTLHVMATSWADDALGSGSVDLVVRDPVFADLTLPRFLAPGDTATSLVSLVNTEGTAGHYSVHLAATGPASFTGPTVFDADLVKGARKTFSTGIKANQSGIVHLVATVQDSKKRVLLTRSWDMQIRPGHYPVTQSTVQKQDPGQSYQPSSSLLASFEPGSSVLTLGYSGINGIDTIGLLQTVAQGYGNDSSSLAASSRAFLAFKGQEKLARLVAPEGVDKSINAAIAMLIDREDAGGRFGSWRLNDGRLLPWEQIYVVDFLTRAKDAGYSVPSHSLAQALDWLETSQVQSPGDEDRHASEAEGAVTPETRAYALYVLARAGRLNTPALRALADHSSVRIKNGTREIFWGSPSATATFADALALGHLAGGLALGNERTLSNDLFGMAVDSLGPVRSGRPGLFDLGYWIYLRDLGALVPLAAESGNRGLAQKLTDRFGLLDVPLSWIGRETATALLETATAMNKPDPSFAIAVNGKELARPIALPAIFTPKASELDAYRLTNTGASPLWLTVTTSGTPKDAPTPVDSGFHISVRTMTLQGTAFDAANARQNDRFVVVIEGHALDRNSHHCIITDMLPAGWEIESALKGQTSDDDTDSSNEPQGVPGLGETTTPSMIALKDDRFFAAFDLGGGSYSPRDATMLGSNDFRFAYIVRAVTPGAFLRPETVVQDRFSPGLTGRTASGRVAVTPR